MPRLLLAVAAVLLPAASAIGQFALVDDQRSIDVNVEIELTDPDDGKTLHFFGDSDSALPPAPFAPFTDVAFARAEASPINWGEATGGQLSTASPTLLKGEGQITGEGRLGFAIPPSFLNASGISVYRVTFEVSGHTLVRLNGELSTTSVAQGAGTNGFARARVSRVFEEALQPLTSTTIQGTMVAQLDQELRLAPGTYEHELFAQAGVFTTSGDAPFSSASFDAQLEFVGAMCGEADLAAPFGEHDFSDVVAFLVAFDSQEQIADLAPPFGVLDFTDVVIFIERFAVGCP